MLSVVLFACDPIRLSPVPSQNATVYGNGGSAVVKDNYLYFANAYIDMSTIGINDNKYDAGSNQIDYAIYRTKLGEYGRLKLDEDGKPQNVELVTYNVGGYAYSGLYICGEYLYYSTPYTVANSDGSKTTGLVRIERVKLDGTGREVVYSVSNFDSNSDYDIFYVDGVTYIVILDSSKNLSIVKCMGKNINKFLNVASNVTGFKLYEQQNISQSESLADAYKYIYYTTNSGSTYSLYRKPFDLSEDATRIDTSSSEIKLISVKNQRVYYIFESKIYSTAFADGGFVRKLYSSVQTSESTSFTITQYLVLDDRNGLDTGVIGVYYDGTNYSFYVYNSNGTSLSISHNVAITLLFVQNEEVYYQKSGDEALYKISLSFPSLIPTASAETEVVSQFSMVGDDAKSRLDFDEDRIYVYATHNSSDLKYLTMYMRVNPYLDDDGNAVGHYIGTLSAADSNADK
jgi:hypothetical protein